MRWHSSLGVRSRTSDHYDQTPHELRRVRHRASGVLHELARAGETILVEKNGHAFSISPAEPELDPRLPPLAPLDVRMETLRRGAGGFHTPDRQKLLNDLRIMRQQDGEERPG